MLRPRRISRYFVIVVILVCLGGMLYLWRGVGNETVYVAVNDLPTFHQLKATDFASVQMRRSDVPDGAIRSDSQIAGRYTVSAVNRGRPLVNDVLGPRLNSGVLDSRFILAMEVSSADLHDVIAEGDLVDIVAGGVPPGPGRGVIRDVIVLAVGQLAGSAERYSLTMAIRRQDEDRLVSVGQDVRILVVRTSPYTRVLMTS